jgi:anti-sigma regulatory factor (Ser/Thr protein kinase)
VRRLDADRSGFHHEALLYRGDADFAQRSAAFVREGLEAHEVVLVAVDRRKLELLRARLGPDVENVTFLDMAEVGKNPARIIPVWRSFVETQLARGRRPRGIGEPAWPGRSGAELAECRRHESLLNLAFADGPAWTLLCPYDAAGLDPAVLEGARCTHPVVADGCGRAASPCFEGAAAARQPFDEPLPEPVGEPVELAVDARSLSRLRSLVTEAAGRAGIGDPRTAGLVLAAHEVAANSIRHGGGSGRVRIWTEPGAVVCELSDGGWIADPLAGRRRPSPGRLNGRGLWLANHLCDLVELRSSRAGTTVRLHVSEQAAAAA